MPQLFRIGAYIVYFWANESRPLEPIHVHIAEGTPSKDGTKLWITQTGHCILCHNRSQIPMYILKNIMRIVEANSVNIRDSWIEMFDEVTYFC